MCGCSYEYPTPHAQLRNHHLVYSLLMCVCVCAGDDVRALAIKDTLRHESRPQGQN